MNAASSFPPLRIIETLGACASTSRILASFDKTLLEWADRESLFEPFLRQLEEHADLSGSLTEEWVHATANQYVAGKLYSGGPLLPRCIQSLGSSLKPDASRLLASFLDTPWRYALFSVKGVIADTLFSVHDYFSGEELLLQSDGLARLHKRGVPLVLTLLLNNGHCFQTYGPLHAHIGFEPSDFLFFARMLDSRLVERKGLGACMAKTPIPFFLLDCASQVPPIAHKGKRVVYCFHSLKATGFDPGTLRTRGHFSTESRELMTRLCLDGKDSPFDLAHVYYDGKNDILAVHTSGMESYGRLRDLILPDIEFPEQPFWMSSANMTATAGHVLRMKEPEDDFSSAFDEEPTPEETKDLETMNAFMRKAADRSNYGLPISYEELAEKHGIPLETARQVQRMMDRQGKRFFISLKGGIPGFSPPPPAVRMKMKGPLAESELFILSSSDRTRELFHEHDTGFTALARTVGREAPDFQEMPAIVDDLSLKHWHTTDSTIIAYSFILLLAAGKDFRPADDYATEILRLFWQVLIPNKGKKSILRFQDKYTSYCQKILAAAGLVQTEAGAEGRCLVKRTRFFEEWVRIVK
jgi:hypothetical protein